MLLWTITHRNHYFAQLMHFTVFRIDHFCCYFPCFHATSCFVTGQYFCYIDLTEGETTVWCGLNDSFHLGKVVCVRARVRFGSSILNAMLCVKPHSVPIYHLAHLNHMDNSFFNTLVICHLSVTSISCWHTCMWFTPDSISAYSDMKSGAH